MYRYLMSNIIEELNQSGLADRNADLEIDVLGVLSYTMGAKLRLSYIDDINDQDICEWNYIARQNGAVNVTSRVNTNKGQIQLNIEYKSNKNKNKPNKPPVKTISKYKLCEERFFRLNSPS